MVPRREALLGSTFDTRKICAGCPAIAYALPNSASPYISAVSMWVMPRSMPRRKAATAVLRSPWSMYQVPCPITDTCGPFCPNFCCLTMTSNRLLDLTPLRGATCPPKLNERRRKRRSNQTSPFRDGPKDQTSDVQLHIGESRDSRPHAPHRPAITAVGSLRHSHSLQLRIQ